MRQMTGADASFLYLETKQAPMHIGSISLYDASGVKGGAGFAEVRQGIADRLHLVRAFRERVVRMPLDLDHPVWIEDPDFNLDYHVHHLSLPRPGNWDALMRLAGRIMSRPLDQSRPLWELFFVEGLNIRGLPKETFAVILKVHHAAIDGVGGAQLAEALHDTSPRARRPKGAGRRFKPDPVPSEMEMLTRTAGHMLQRPVRIADVVGRTALSVMRMRRTTQDHDAQAEAAHATEDAELHKLPGFYEAPRTPLNGHVTQQRAVGSVICKRADAEAARKLVPGATLNDVMLTICGGAFRKYLQRRNELPADSLLVLAPVSIRTAGQSGAGGNRVSAMVMRIGTDIADPVERMRAIHEVGAGSKRVHKAMGKGTVPAIQEALPGAAAIPLYRLMGQLQTVGGLHPLVNFTITNVPGPKKPLYMGGARLIATCGLGPLFEGVGAIVAIFTYADTVTLTITCAQDMMPDVGDVAALIGKDLKTLARKADRLPARPKTAAKAKPKARTKTKGKAKAKASAVRKSTAARPRRPVPAARGGRARAVRG